MTKDTEALRKRLALADLRASMAPKPKGARDDVSEIISALRTPTCEGRYGNTVPKSWVELNHERELAARIIERLATPASAELGFDPTMEVGDQVFPHDAMGSDVAPVGEDGKVLKLALAALDIADRLIEREFGLDMPEEWETAFKAVANANAHPPHPASVDPVAGGEALHPDTIRLNAMLDECWDLRSFAVPTGGDDADVAWKVVGHWMAEPHERVIAEGWNPDPRFAIDAALAALKRPSA